MIGCDRASPSLLASRYTLGLSWEPFIYLLPLSVSTNHPFLGCRSRIVFPPERNITPSPPMSQPHADARSDSSFVGFGFQLPVGMDLGAHFTSFELEC